MDGRYPLGENPNRVVVIPVFVAFILAALLTPAVNVVARRVPRLIATWVVMVATVAVFIVGGLLLAPPISSATSELDTEFSAAIDDLEDRLRTGPIGLEQERIDTIFDGVRGAGDRVLNGLTAEPACARGARCAGGQRSDDGGSR